MKRIFILILLITSFTFPHHSHADIPFNQAKGLLEATKDQYKRYSPLWAMMTINSVMLGNLRFFGNYKTIESEGYESEQGQDPIAELIRQLFRSPDGIQFVATTYQFDPAGDLSRHLEKINDIIAILLEMSDASDSTSSSSEEEGEELPQKKELAKKLSQDKKALELQLKTLEGEELERAQAEHKAKSDELTRLSAELREAGKKSATGQRDEKKRILNAQIRTLQTRLNKTQDPTEKNKIQQEVNALQEEFNKLKPPGSQMPSKLDRLIAILDSIASYREASDADVLEEARALVRKKVKKENVVEAVKQQQELPIEEELDLQDRVDRAQSLEAAAEEMLKYAPERAFALLKDEIAFDENNPQTAREFLMPAYREKIRQFAQLMLSAYEAEKELANLELPDKQIYPKDITIISLLAFFVKVADSKEALRMLPLLMKDSEKYYRAAPYSEDDFNKTTLTEEIVKNDPEAAFLYSRAYSVYKDPVIPTFGYRSSTQYGDFSPFPDCGESSLRYILLAFLTIGRQGKDITGGVKSLEMKLAERNPKIDLNDHTAYQKFKKYMLSHADLSTLSAQKQHNEWSDVVSNLNDQNTQPTMNDVQYGRGPRGNGLYAYEIKSNFYDRHFEGVQGIVNMFNVIAKLIPDKVLNTPWSEKREERLEQVEQKLTHLCELFSTDDTVVEWEVKGGWSIENEFTVVNFMVNGNNSIEWHFEDGHFYPEKVTGIGQDPRNQFNLQNFPFFNAWIASMYVKNIESGKETLPQNIIPILFSEGMRSLENIIPKMNSVKYFHHQFLPELPRWVHNSFPFGDQYALDRFFVFWTNFMTTCNEDESLKDFKHLFFPLYNKFNVQGKTLLLKTLDFDRKHELIEELVTHGVSAKGDPKKGLTPIFYAKSLEPMKILVKAGANLNEMANDHGVMIYPLFHYYVNEAATKAAIQLGANVNAIDLNGETILSRVVRLYEGGILGIRPFCQQMIAAGADLNAGTKPILISAIEGEISEGFIDLIFGIKNLLKKTDLTRVYENGNNVLHLAVNKSRKEIVKAILEQTELDVNSKNTDGKSPIYFSSTPEITETLLNSQKVKVNQQDNYGRTYLFDVLLNFLISSDYEKNSQLQGPTIMFSNRYGFSRGMTTTSGIDLLKKYIRQFVDAGGDLTITDQNNDNLRSYIQKNISPKFWSAIDYDRIWNMEKRGY